MTIIKPSSQLRNDYKGISSICNSTGNPVHITVNGEGDTVLLSNKAYEEIEAKLETLKVYELLGVNLTAELAKAELDYFSNPERTSHEDMMKRMNTLIAKKRLENE